MNAALTPRLATRPRPRDPDSYEARYLRTFLWLRTFVGVLGIALPVVVIVVATAAFGERSIRPSLSGYYYSGARDIFVAILSATGVFFIGYVLAEKSLENTLSGVAGVSALVIAIFPTRRPSKAIPLTPLQKLLHEHTVEIIHYVSSATFIVALTGISFLYGWRERHRPRRDRQKRSPVFWGRYHFVCAGLLALSLVWIAATVGVGRPPHARLIGEWVSAWSFGASWLMKGLELEVLFRRAPGP
jgi:hypothetical protein